MLCNHLYDRWNIQFQNDATFFHKRTRNGKKSSGNHGLPPLFLLPEETLGIWVFSPPFIGNLD